MLASDNDIKHCLKTYVHGNFKGHTMGKMWKFLLLYAITLPAVAAEYTQSASSFEAAVRNISTSPSYVMVTIADANTGLER